MNVSPTSIDLSSVPGPVAPPVHGQQAGAPLWTAPAAAAAEPAAAFGAQHGRVHLDPPQRASRSQDLEGLLTILWAAMQVRDGNAQWRREQAQASVQASKEQIGWMAAASNALFASAGVSALLGGFTLLIGAIGSSKNLADSRSMKGMADPAEIRHLQNTIDTRNSFQQTLNGVAQSGAAFGTGIATATKSLQDVWAKEEELAATVASHDKELFQRYIDDQMKMIGQLIQLIQEIQRNENQGFRAAGTLA